MIYDTNFLIAIQGRAKGFSRADAFAWVKAHDRGFLMIPELVRIEFVAGFKEDSEAAPYLERFTVLPLDKRVLEETVRVMRELRVTGEGIRAADSIIAATARLYGQPIVTDNIRHLGRVKGVKVVGYR